MKKIKTELKKAIISFIEAKSNGELYLMTRTFKNEERAKNACSDLLNSERQISNLELKLIFQVNKEVANQ